MAFMKVDVHNPNVELLEAFTTAELEAELARRREVEHAKQDAERKAREVEIVCYGCCGLSLYRACSVCGGTGKVMAMLAAKDGAT